MSESDFTDGAISLKEIAELAALFDQSEYAFDPMSDECKEASVLLENRIRDLFEDKILPQSSILSLYHFRCAIRKQCRLYVRNNP